jgi:hypothetical protein
LDDDSKVPQTSDEKSLAAAQLLHGNKIFSSNRWFDKAIQVSLKTKKKYKFFF